MLVGNKVMHMPIFCFGIVTAMHKTVSAHMEGTTKKTQGTVIAAVKLLGFLKGGTSVCKFRY